MRFTPRVHRIEVPNRDFDGTPAAGACTRGRRYSSSMPSPPRSRKLGRAVINVVKWGGLVVTVLLLVVWIGSGWKAATRINASGRIDVVCYGAIRIHAAPSGRAFPPHGWRMGQTQTPYIYWWFGRNGSGPSSVYIIPLWPAVLLALLATAAAWRADSQHLRRARAGMCPACGYDRAGLAAGVACPECGAAASA